MEYTGDRTFDRVLFSSLAVTATILSLAKYQKRAPYGKFGGSSRVVNLDAKFGWWLMEIPATVSFLYNYFKGRQAKLAKEKANPEEKKKGPSGWATRVFLFIWCLHYGNRGWFFPLTIRVAQGSKQSFALFNAAIGAVFLTAHGYLNGRLFSELGTKYTDKWLSDPRFLVGLFTYLSGYAITVHSEHIMRNLRPADGIVSAADRYKIPMGGMFNYVTNATYFGELTAWTGFLVMSWSPTVLPMIFISLGNLVPRAFEQHKWYMKKFPDYPKDRKVIVPFLI